MTKADVCSVIDGLWVSKSDREALKYKVRSYAYAADELDKIGEGYQNAVDEQLEIIKTFASQVVASPQVQQLRDANPPLTALSIDGACVGVRVYARV